MPLHGFQGLSLPVAVIHGDIGAGLRQGEGHGLADAPGGPGHQSYFAGEVVEHLFLHEWGQRFAV